jgi:glycosyltransferase involved in cell wall biosynthesis
MNLQGCIEQATRERVLGWAHDSDAADARVSLLITVNDVLVTRVLADRPREDLLQAGIGDGAHSFDISLNGLSPLSHHVVAVQREQDGAHLPGSPAVVAPATRFDQAFQAQCAALILDAVDDDALTQRLRFLAIQTETLLQRRAERQSRGSERAALRQLRRRWAPGQLPPAGNDPDNAAHREELPPRALVIDHALPAPRRDAGSEAVLSHMLSLQRLGFEVGFAAADMSPHVQNEALDLLAAAGITVYGPPWHGSVEEVLRREADGFDLVYLHRAPVAADYLHLVRHHQPRTRLIYSVADLHHLRLARQADIEQRPELLALARRMRALEWRTAAAADAVVTHSSHEAALLREHLRHQSRSGAAVHVVPWAIPPRPTEIPFAERRGFAFIGHYAHAPNNDAAHWLIDEIVPALRGLESGIPCLLAGSAMPEALLRRAGRLRNMGIEVLGQVPSLSDVFDRVRLTVAPLAFGAGVKGKVLESLAAGIPCVCTPIAAEGLDLPPLLASLVAANATGLAANIVRLHEDASLNQECAEAGLAYVTDMLSEARIDRLMHDVAGLPAEL